MARFLDSKLVTLNTKLIFSWLPIDEKEDMGPPVIRLFGVNAAGNSVCAHVHNFTAYFYIHIIEEIPPLTDEQIENFRMSLNSSVHARDAVREIEQVEKYPIMYY